MAKSYSVKAPLIIAKNEVGADVYVYQGAPVPDGQSDDWIARHVDDGLIVEGEFVPDPPRASDVEAASDTPAAKTTKTSK